MLAKVVLICCYLSATLGHAQAPSIRGLRIGDTLHVQMDHIACTYGLDTRTQFTLVHGMDAYRIQYADAAAWVPLTQDQEAGLRRFDRECMKSECPSTSYVAVDLLEGSNRSSFQVCWSVADELIAVLKRR